MILPRFEYRKAADIASAIALFEGAKGRAQYLAGGTDLVPLLKWRLSTPDMIIDLKGIEELSRIRREKDRLIIGPNATLFEMKHNDTIMEYFPALVESLEATSCETLQMRGTIGGNLLQNTRCLFYNKSIEWRKARGFCYKMGADFCNVVPKAKECFSNYCSDNALALISVSASVSLAGPKGQRTIRLEKIFTGDGRNPFALKPGEVLTEIHIPIKRSSGAYEKLRVRNSIDYPLLGVAISVIGKKGKVCVGGIGPAPLVYDLKGLDSASIKDLAKEARKQARPVANTVLSPGYRKKMVEVLIQRAMDRASREVR
jgi:4-hydroxybenzoyl-CoA reductase subunit beta